VTEKCLNENPTIKLYCDQVDNMKEAQKVIDIRDF